MEEGEGGLGDGGKDGPPYRSGVTGQACSARDGSGPKGLLVKTLQVGSFSRVLPLSPLRFQQRPSVMPGDCRAKRERCRSDCDPAFSALISLLS